MLYFIACGMFICHNCYNTVVSGLLFFTAAVGCDTKAALNYVRSLFHAEVFEHCIPPIILHHQLYSIVHSRTVVDKELVRSRSNSPF